LASATARDGIACPSASNADGPFATARQEESSVARILFIGFGGFLGAVLRYVISGFIQNLTKSISFPYGTLGVNLIGCLIIGMLSQLSETRALFTAEARSFIFIGVLGSFTTFSTFGNETLNLLRTGQNFPALANMGIHLILGLAAVWYGHALAYQIWR
jgi:CrcB protein